MTGDTVYGGSEALRAWLEERRQPYVLAIAANDGVDLPDGDGVVLVLPGDLARYALDPHEWRRLSAGDGAKGPHVYDWARVPLATPTVAGLERAVVIRHPRDAPDDPTQQAYYLTFAPADTPTAALVAVAGRRWRVEEALEGRGGAGSGQGGTRAGPLRGAPLGRLVPPHHTGAVRLGLPGRAARPGARRQGVAVELSAALVPLTVPEVRRLLWRLAGARDAADATGALRWSAWRRRHQADARRCHYRRLGLHPP